MQEYKREKATLESQVKELTKAAAYHDDHLRSIDAWFKQVSDSTCTLFMDSLLTFSFFVVGRRS